MKLCEVVVPIFVAGLGIACSQPPATTSSSSAAAPVSATAPAEDVEATIAQLERNWVQAIVKKDTAALERILADDFNGTSPTAHTYTRTAAVNDIKSASYVVDSMELDEISVNVYGNTAVALTSQEEKSRYDGRDTSGHFHFTDVWVNRDGRWQVVASHGTRFDTGH